MPSKIPHINLLSACLTLLTALMLSSCINDDEMCPSDGSDPSDGPGVTLEFTMLTRNAASSRGSRALMDTDISNKEIGFAAENYLDLDNLTFLLFDNQKKLLRTFKPDVTPESAGSYIKYRVKAFLHDNYFLKATTDNITFTIVVLGNYAGLDPQRFNYYIGEDLATIFDENKVGTFAAPEKDKWGLTWIPTITEKYLIPMAGMQTFTVSMARLRASSPDNPCELSDEGTGGQWINMLRALAKIEVIDKIGFTEGIGDANGTYAATRSSIEKVEMVGHTLRGSILPSFNQWNRAGFLETQYVTKPSAPASLGYVGITPNEDNVHISDNSSVLNFFMDTEAVAREKGANVFSCYLTEYDPDEAHRYNVPSMWMRLTVQSPATPMVVSRFFRLEAAPYENNLPGGLMPLLRNNIYRYVIIGISAEADLKLQVEDWTSSVTNWEYSDNPAIAEGGYMKWYKDGTEIFADRTTARLVIARDEPVVGRFTLDEPKNCKWTARFANESEIGAFKFIIGENEDGTHVYSDEASGIIDGRQAGIQIVAVNPPSTVANRTARLIITVDAPGNRTLTADIVGDDYGQNQYFTIVQNQN